MGRHRAMVVMEWGCYADWTTLTVRGQQSNVCPQAPYVLRSETLEQRNVGPGSRRRRTEDLGRPVLRISRAGLWRATIIHNLRL